MLCNEREASRENQIFRPPEADCAAEGWCRDNHLVRDALSKFKPGFQALYTQLRVVCNWSQHYQKPHGRHFGAKPTVMRI